MKKYGLIFTFFLICSYGFPEDALDIPGIIGMDMESAIERFGMPEEIFPVRGEEMWQDDVVFYYEYHLYLFWFQNRVWQVRMDQRYKHDFFEVRMGFSREEVLDTFGKPLKGFDDSLIYDLEDRGYPLRVRFFFTNNVLDDAYFYRGDF